MPPPKALLFDIGGVCVASPMRAILLHETALSIPPGWVNYSISRSAPTGAWHQLERGEIPLDASFFAAFNADLARPELWAAHWAKSGKGPAPSMPSIDGEKLFWEMMEMSRTPDRYMFAALKRLRDSGRFVLGALSNTVKFPDGHRYNDPVDKEHDVKGVFDVFVSSAHHGVRKPDREAYELAMQWLRVEMQKQKRGTLEVGEVVFLDDIGENCKAARKFGLGTIKVQMGNTKEAVIELERITGMKLLDDEARL